MIEGPRRYEKYAVWPLLIVITLAVFGQVARFDFVNFDDPKYVAQNRHVLDGLSRESVAWAFTTTYFSNWHPLTWISYMLDAQLFGKDPGWFHVTNLLVHTANVLLLFAVLWQMTGALWRSALVAALFAIHPLHVESVVWVSERKDVLSTLFGLLSIGAYAHFARRLQRRWYLLALLFFAASMMSKQMLVTLPFVLLLLDYWPLHRVPSTSFDVPSGGSVEPASRSNAKDRTGTGTGTEERPPFLQRPVKLLILEKIPFLALSVLFCVVAYATHQQSGTMSLMKSLSTETRLFNAVLVYIIYLRQTVWPSGLAVFYPHVGDGISVFAVVSAAFVIFAVTFVAWAQRRRRPYLLIGWLWYLGTLVPVIGIVQIGAQRMADRYTYVSLIGVFIAFSWLIGSFIAARTWCRIIVPGLAVAAVAAFSWIAYLQTEYWENSVELFNRALAVTENNTTAHNNLGTALYSRGKYEQAIYHFQAALSIDPDSSKAHNNLGNALDEQKLYDEALVQYREAVRTGPTNAMAHNNLAVLLVKLDRYEEAAHHLREALRIAPEHAKAHSNLGVLLVEVGSLRDAISHLRAALKFDPEDTKAHYNLGKALCDLGQFDEGMRHYERTLELNSEFPRAQNNWGVALCRRGHFEEAIDHFLEALRIDPLFAEAHNNLGRSLCDLGRYDEGIVQYHKALDADPRFVQAHENLGAVLEQQERPDEAIHHFQEALALNPDSAHAHFRLGSLLLRQGKREAALIHLREAIRLRPNFSIAQEMLDRALAE
jgi:tetratricopeptide (TPR) repeat protein